MAKGDAKKQPAAAKPKRAPVDWDRIEPGWRAGIKSVLQLAADYQSVTGNSVSHTAINKHFREKDIPRDLAAKVQAKAESLVSADAVSTQVSTEPGAETSTLKPSDAAIIEANAGLVASVMLSQRKDIGRNRRLAMTLLNELEGQTMNLDALQQLGMLMYAPDDKGRDKLNDTYMKIISSAGRIDSMKKLADTLKVLVGLEREAYGITNEKEGGDSYEDDLKDI